MSLHARIPLVLLLLAITDVTSVYAQRRRADPQIATHHDRATNLKSFTLLPYPENSVMRISAMFQCEGGKPCMPDAVMMMLISQGGDVKLDSVAEITVELGAAGSTRFGANFTIAPGSGGASVELVSWTVPTAFFRSITEADRVVYVAGSRRHELSAAEKYALGALARKMAAP